MPDEPAFRIARTSCEGRASPLGIDNPRPRLSWTVESRATGYLQSAYRIQVVREGDDFERGPLVWDSGARSSRESAWLPYGGPPLRSRTRYLWRARAWDSGGRPSPWSAPDWWEMGLLERGDWEARWIEPEQEPASAEPRLGMAEFLGLAGLDLPERLAPLRPCPLVARRFSVPFRPLRARIYATAHGLYALELNGRRVGDAEFCPGATAYGSYLQYQTYDATPLVREGENALGAALADGWWAGRIGLPGESLQYGDRLGLLVQIEVEGGAGERLVVASDGSFMSRAGPWDYADIFIGERYDARREEPAWSSRSFDDSAWRPVLVRGEAGSNLVADRGFPVRRLESLAVRRVLRTLRGQTVLDFGRVIAGRVRFRATRPAGTEIRLRHSEALDAGGNFARNIVGRNKDQRDVYVCSGRGLEEHESSFTYHGFRYVEVEGDEEGGMEERYAAVVLGSDLEATGAFSCSDEGVNSIYSNVVWSQRANLFSIPTDCPQRERAGFTGDAQAFIRTACWNQDVKGFFERWLENLALEQRPDGQVPTIVPYWRSYEEVFFPAQGAHSSAGWGDACIVVPWTLYSMYGDRSVLEACYPTMVRWMRYIEARCAESAHEGDPGPEAAARRRYLWRTGFHFGDWLIPSMSMRGMDPFEAAEATKGIVAACCYAICADLMSRIARELGRKADEDAYADLTAKIRAAFAEEHLDGEGRLRAGFQGAYVLALAAHLAPPGREGAIAGQLARSIADNGGRLDAGFVSIPYLLGALTEVGRADLAYDLLFQTGCPSWLYEVGMGATTIWESWDSVRPDGSFRPGVSLNHYAFGCVGDWLFGTVAGLSPAEPGFRKIRIAPRPDPRLRFAQARFESAYGEIYARWERSGGSMRVWARVPPNAEAELVLPGVGEGEVAGIEGSGRAERRGGALRLLLGSGSHEYEYAYRP